MSDAIPDPMCIICEETFGSEFDARCHVHRDHTLDERLDALVRRQTRIKIEL